MNEPTVTNSQENGSILIADRNPADLSPLVDRLGERGINVVIAADGDNALKQLGENSPDLLLLDVLLPGLDGYELCRRLKDDPVTEPIPVILMSATADTVDKAKSYELGAVDHLTKPLDYAEAIARVARHLSIYKQQKTLRAHSEQLEEQNLASKRVLDAFRTSRERYRLLAENSTDMISIQTPEGVFQYVSPACRTLLGYEIEDLVGQSAAEFIHPEDLKALQESSQADQAKSSASTVTYRVRRKDHSFVWLETTSKIVRDKKRGIPLEIIAVSRNIHDRKLAEEALQKAHDELERRVAERTAELAEANEALKQEIAERKRAEAEIQAYSEELKAKNEALSRLDELKNEFLANTSHELRTPLNGIIGIAESMLDGATGSLSPQQMYNLSMVVSSGGRLANLVNNILDFSKLKYHQLDLQLKPVDMRAVTDVVLILSQPLVGQKSLQLINNIESDVPSVNADEGRVQQILHNLIGNAIKFTEAGQVTVSAAVKDDMLAVTVSDTGIGIPEDKLKTIFRWFDQVDASATREYRGTGLGLSITKQLVELHGGTIQVESTPSQGSRFTFTLPLVTEPLPSKGTSTPTVTGAISTPVVTKTIEPVLVVPSQELIENKDFTILVVDDELINVQILTNYLSLQNYAVAQAFDGFEALEALEEVKPDLVLLDIMMPKMSGYEVCRKIRERYLAHELPIMLLTAKSQISDLVAGFEAGANDYLTKPFDKNELLARVKTHLRLAKINIAYGRFVPHELLQFLEKESIVDVHLGDQVQREMSILFSDIRSFTTLSEKMTPQENFDFINSYLSQVSPIIRQHNGFIDKYIGDAVMALFPEKVEDALQAAIAMRHELSRFNQQRLKEGFGRIDIGTGIHVGALMLGTIGEAERMEGTVISDAVNLTVRLEGLTKWYGAAIVVSEHVLFNLDRPTEYHFRFLDRVQVKGREDPVSVFEIFSGDPEAMTELKLETLSDFERGLLHYHSQEFTEAKAYFEKVLQHNPADDAARLYLRRVDHFMEYGVPLDWEGIEALTSK